MVRAYIKKVTGLSLPQVTRLVRKHRQSGRVELQAVRRKRFPTKYTEPDVVLLAEDAHSTLAPVDRAHGVLSGPECAFKSCASGFATVSFDARGKRKRRYLHKDYTTPYEKFKSLPPGCGLSEGGLEHWAARPIGAGHERHRVRPEDESGENQTAAKVQNRVPSSTGSLYLKRRQNGCGNDGTVETMENQEQVFHRFHRPLEISPTTRDFHIPTAGLRPGWNSGKPKSGFPLFHPELAKTMGIPPDSNLKTKKGSRPLRGLLILGFQDHSALETNIDFRIILVLENASQQSQIERSPAHYPSFRLILR